MLLCAEATCPWLSPILSTRDTLGRLHSGVQDWLSLGRDLPGGAALGLWREDPEQIVGDHVEVVVAVGGGEDPDLQGGQSDGAEPAPAPTC